MKKIFDKYFLAIKKLLPEKVVKPSVGLDIGADTCKVIELLPSQDSYAILNWAVEPTDKVDLSVTLKKIFNKIKVQPNSVCAALSGHGTLTRYIEMPKMSSEDLQQSVLVEADKHFPFDKNQIYTDCYILDGGNKDNKMSVLIAAAKKEIVEQRLQLFTNLGMQVDFIGLNALAIANVFNMLNPYKGSSGDDSQKQPAVVAVLDMGNAVSSLVIIKDNIPRFSRDMFIGGRDLTKRISNALGMQLSEAEAIKCNPQDKLGDIMNACDSILMNLVSEIRLSFDYFVTEYNLPISKLFLTGGSSMLKGSIDFLKKNFDIPVMQWDPLSLIQLPEASRQEMQQHAHQLGVALGLALYRHD